MTIDQCIKALERDRREPDKVLLHISSLKRAVDDARREFELGNDHVVWEILYIDHTTPEAIR